MNDGEKLIEEAAEQRYPHRDVFLEGVAYMSEERSRIPLREAFVEGAKWQAEKAHTLPDDEREALANALREGERASRSTGGSAATLFDSQRDAILAAGFRRAVVPEPSENARVAQGIRAFTRNVRSELDATREANIPLGDSYLEGVYSALRQADDHAARIENDLYGERPAPRLEPQGEPSDAQVEQAVAEALCASENAGVASWGMLTDEQREWYIYQARAALRAASAVTEQGENR